MKVWQLVARGQLRDFDKEVVIHSQKVYRHPKNTMMHVEEFAKECLEVKSDDPYVVGKVDTVTVVELIVENEVCHDVGKYYKD